MKQDRVLGPAWIRMIELPRRLASDVEIQSIPNDPGVYAWFRSAEPVYAGKASGAGGLRDRLTKHFGVGTDLSRSSLRRNVAEQLFGIPTSVSRQRPSAMADAHVAEINAWVRALKVAWLIFPTPVEAIAFERELLGEWMPPLSKR